jgi:hypothetical protein
MQFFFFFLFTASVFAITCKPDEIYIREQLIDGYKKVDGTKVSSHSRDAHCRQIKKTNHFQDSTNQKFTNIEPKIKRWNQSEKTIVQENIGALPPWLSKYHLAEIIRGDIGGHPKNPAANVASTRTLIIFDRFFREENKRAVIIHEMAHIAFQTIDPIHKVEFVQASGWTVDDNFEPRSPQKLLKPDSIYSIEEDFSNYVEAFYVDQTQLMTFNPLAFLVIKKIIESKENEK